MHNKKGQVGETVTWIVATAIIVLILAVSLFASEFAFGKSKKLDFYKTTDTLASKSFFSYLLTKNPEGKIVYEQIKEQEDLNEFNENLGKDIFQKFYGSEYAEISVRVDATFEQTMVEFVPGKVLETVKLKDNKAILMALFK